MGARADADGVASEDGDVGGRVGRLTGLQARTASWWVGGWRGELKWEACGLRS